MTGGIVEHQMHIEIIWNRRLDLVRKGAELFATVPSLAGAAHAAGHHIQGCKQVGGAIASVITASALNLAWAHRQNRSCLRRLDLRFFVHSMHQRAIRWIVVEANDIPDLVDKGRITRQLQRLLPTQLQAKGVPDARHHGLAQPHVLGHAAGGPMRGGGRLVFWIQCDEAFVLVIAHPSRRTGAGRIAQAL